MLTLQRLHEMFKAFASKMEDDVARLKNGLEKVAGGHNALVDRVGQLEAKLAQLQGAGSTGYMGPKLSKTLARAKPVEPAAPPKVEVLPPEPEDALWSEGEE
jgi:hypothetical protein